LKKYSRETIAQVLAANDIVDVIGESVELKNAGASRFKGLSPFTNEKTPSFMVSRDRQMFYCFSSSQGGDLLQFLMQFEGISFNEALEKLAARAGIHLEASGKEDDREAYQRRRILELNSFALRFYRQQLKSPETGTAAQEYLKKRGMHPATEAHFSLGLAVDSFSAFKDAALKEGFREGELIASGLVRQGEKNIYDFFRNRLIIPIRDISGNAVAFGGRDLGDSPAKYINSPETSVYKKSRTLYGLFEAREAITREKTAILVEGYFDLMRCAENGIENVVATCGTALTEQQAMLLKRYAPKVVVVYDGDTAGVRAALRSIALLTGAGLTVHAAAPPEGQDPDDFIRDHGADAFRNLINTAPDFVSFYIAMQGEQKNTIEGRTELAHTLFSILRVIDEPIRLEQYLNLVAEALNIHVWECRRNFERFIKSRRFPEQRADFNEKSNEETLKTTKDDIDFLAALLEYPSLRIKAAALDTELELSHPVLSLARLINSRKEEKINVQDLPEGEERNLFSAAAVAEAPPPEKAERLIEERLARFAFESCAQKMNRLQQEVRRATQDQDAARSAELYKRIVELKQFMESLATS